MHDPIGQSGMKMTLIIPMKKLVTITALVWACLTVIAILGLERNDPINVSMNKVWPAANPSETYRFYDAVPFCKPHALQFEPLSFGQIMRGDRLVNSIYAINYLVPVANRIVCERTISSADLQQLKTAIDRSYVFELYVRDLPVTKAVGLRLEDDHGTGPRYLVGTHLHFELGYNGREVVSVKLNGSSDKDLVELDLHSPGQLLTFRYSVTWTPSEIPAHERLRQQLAGLLAPSARKGEVQPISNVSALALVITFIMILVLLRTIRTDLARYLKLSKDDLTGEVISYMSKYFWPIIFLADNVIFSLEEESGWKLIHGDVFRPPPHRMWLSACVGSGAHLILVAMGTSVVGFITPYLTRGTLLSTAFFGYLTTSFVSGFISANLYRRLNGVKWKWNVIVTVGMFAGPVALIWSALNTIAVVYQSTAAIPFRTAAFLSACWVFITLPLTFIGSIAGRLAASRALKKQRRPFVCKTNRLAREIPRTSWTMSPWLLALLSGFCPFCAFYVQLHNVLLSVWDVRIEMLHGLLIATLAFLLLVASTVSIWFNYFQLNRENYKWWWRTFVSGGSTAIFFLMQCVYYFFSVARMVGFLQISFFFGYSLIAAWVIFLTVGCTSFIANLIFMNVIYSQIKSN